jgi:predicted ABC-type ATPase
MYFIISLGMPGSGKTYLNEKIKKMFNIKPEIILIDELVQRDKTYISAVNKILKTCKGKCLTRPSVKTYKKFEAAYWNTRVNGCGNPKCVDASGCNCYNNKLLNNALKKRSDIIFETALSGPLDWLFKRIPPEYNILFFVNLVDLNTIFKRIKMRVKSEIRRKIAPRLPQSNKKFLIQRRKHLYKNLVDLLKRKERIILYDNLEKKIIYDGQTNMGLKKIIYSY